MPNHGRGHTLLELMIALAVTAILLAHAVQGYRSHVLRAGRVAAQRALLDLAAAQERHYLQNDRYATAGELTLPPPAGLGLAASVEGGYAITIESADAAGFTAAASARGAQAADTGCARFTIDALGVRRAFAAPARGGGPSTSCWR